jgi:hypothetical protein
MGNPRPLHYDIACLSVGSWNIIDMEILIIVVDFLVVDFHVVDFHVVDFHVVMQCAPWRELLSLPPYSLPPWPPWSSAGVDGVAKLLSPTHTNHMRRRSARSAKLNLTATIRMQGARAMMLEEVNNIL